MSEKSPLAISKASSPTEKTLSPSPEMETDVTVRVA